MLAAPELQRHAPRLLRLWEQACEAGPQELEDLLLAFDADGASHANARALPQGLGERNLRLLALRERLLGPQLALLADCPHCASPVEFSLDCRALLRSLNDAKAPREASEEQVLELDGYHLRFRRPVAEDLQVCASALSQAQPPALGPALDSAQFARLLLQRCILDCEPPSEAARLAPLPEPLCQALAERLEQLDPAAHIRLQLHCPDCAQDWSAPLAPAPLLWQELRGQAEQLLSEIGQLARAFGWSEEQVLSLSPRRRQAYLQLCEEVGP